MNSNEVAKVMYQTLDDKKAIDIKILDISKISVLADFMIITGGSNKNQVQALADHVQEELAKQNVHAKHVEGYHSGNWILLDFGDIILHIFNQEDRLFYDLERLWQDGAEVSPENL